MLKTSKERLEELETQQGLYEGQLQDRVSSFLNGFSLKNIGNTLQEFFTKKFWKRQTLLFIGGGAVVFMLLRNLISSSSKKVIRAGQGEGVVVVEEDSRPGFWSQLIRHSIQTFLLTYAKRALSDYLERKRKHAESAK